MLGWALVRRYPAQQITCWDQRQFFARASVVCQALVDNSLVDACQQLTFENVLFGIRSV